MTTIEPGWYPDPADPAVQRYWNGSAWEGKAVPVDAEPPAIPEPVEEPADLEPAVPEAGALTGTEGSGEQPPKIIQRTPGAAQPPDTVPIRSLGVTVGWITNRDVDRILAGRILAHPGSRFVARLVDLLCLLLLNAVVNGYFVYQLFESARPTLREMMQNPESQPQFSDATVTNWWIVLTIAMGLWFAYEVPATLNTGQTLGKRLLGIKVISLAQAEFGWGRLLLRWSYAALPLLCFPFGVILWVLDGIWCIRDRPFRQCLHDKSPGTAVVEAPRPEESHS